MSGITRVGFQFTGYTFQGVPDLQLFDRVATIAGCAESAGFDSLWIMDHLHQIASVGDREDPIFEAYTTLAAIGAVTQSARLGVLVTAGGLRNPALLAKMVTTIDVISKGRAVLGIGAGWHEEEHAAYGIPFPPVRERLERLAEAVQICRAMFTEHAPTFTGKHYSIERPLNVPRPITPGGPPIMIGGSGERKLIPLVARLGDGCNFFGGAATVRHKIDVLVRACESQGRDPATITKTWLGTAIVTNSEPELQASLERLGHELGISAAAARAFALAGTPAQVAEQVRRYRESGVDGMIVSLHDASDLVHLERVGTTLAEAMRD